MRDRYQLLCSIEQLLRGCAIFQLRRVLGHILDLFSIRRYLALNQFCLPPDLFATVHRGGTRRGSL
jgi:hypothetical protein